MSVLVDVERFEGCRQCGDAREGDRSACPHLSG